ncbi:MAG: hypothetical protein ACYDIE_03470 [Candidatus Krumholzibacteriia bacterium]
MSSRSCRIRPAACPACRVMAVAAAALLAAVALAGPALAQRAPNSLFRQVAAPGGDCTLLLPDGWVVEADSAGTAALRVRSADGQVVLVHYRDRTGDLAGGPAPAARRLLAEVVARDAHPGARNLSVSDARPLPDLARAWERRLAAARAGAGVTAEGAVVDLEFQEADRSCRERLAGVVESGPDGWAARAVWGARTPAAEFAQWEPVLSFVLASIAPAQAGGADLIRDALRLALPGESLWRNPFTGGLDAGSFHFGRYRWVDPDGDVVYSFNETFTPNAAGLLGRDDWQKSLPK